MGGVTTCEGAAASREDVMTSTRSPWRCETEECPLSPPERGPAERRQLDPIEGDRDHAGARSVRERRFEASRTTPGAARRYRAQRQRRRSRARLVRERG